MARYAVYVDGFNMFYALKRPYPQFLWLNYRALAETVLGPKDSLTEVIYFSALATWKPDDVRQHQTFIKAQRWAGVEVVLGVTQRNNTGATLRIIPGSACVASPSFH